MTIKKKLIGYGYTDSNGVATLDYNENGTEISTLAPTGSSGYIGKGVGSVQLEAGLHSSETVVSVPCNVLDCIEYDKGLDGEGNHNDAMWQYNSSRINLNRGADGTTVINNHTSYDYLNTNKEGSDSDLYDWGTPICVEFYFEKLNSDSTINSQIQLFDKENDAFTKWITQTGTYRIEARETQVRWWINDQEQTPNTINLGQCLIRFYVQNGASFKFKDFKIYPI